MATRTLVGAIRRAKIVGRDRGPKTSRRRNGVPARRASASVDAVSHYLRARVDSALERETPDALIATLAAVGRQRTGVEAGLLKTYAFRELREMVESAESRRRIWTWTGMSAARPETEAREMACALLDTFWRDHRKDVERLTLNLARDEDKEVRLYAASTMARIVRSNFRSYFHYMRAWSRHADPSVRRQVIIATVAVADPDHPEWARSLLEMVEPHLADRDPYIRRNLGPFAIGQGLLRVYPAATLDRFEKWLASENEIVRWNVAMAFTGPVIPLQWERSLAILKVLAADPRRFVWGAAAMALKNLAQLRPEEVRPVLAQWKEHPALRVAVSTAFNASVR